MGKGFEQFLHLDEDEYTSYVHGLDEAGLRELHATISRKVLGASAGMGAGVGGAFFTAGWSLVGSAISARRLNVNNRRLAMIQARLEEMEWSQYELKKRDFAIPLAAITAASLVVPGADALIGHFAGHAATHVASTAHVATSAAAHHGVDATKNVLEHPEMFARSVEHGVEYQVNELTTGALCHVPAAGCYPDLASQNASAVGWAAGEALAKAGEVKGASYTVSKVTEIGLERACKYGASR